MTETARLRNKLMHTIQRLPADRLAEISRVLDKLSTDGKSKKYTLSLGGSWQDLNADLLNDLTLALHTQRANDRAITTEE